mgnify:CR=1 FL=1
MIRNKTFYTKYLGIFAIRMVSVFLFVFSIDCTSQIKVTGLEHIRINDGVIILTSNSVSIDSISNESNSILKKKELSYSKTKISKFSKNNESVISITKKKLSEDIKRKFVSQKIQTKFFYKFTNSNFSKNQYLYQYLSNNCAEHFKNNYKDFFRILCYSNFQLNIFNNRINTKYVVLLKITDNTTFISIRPPPFRFS